MKQILLSDVKEPTLADGSSSDLQRCFAQRLLVDHSMDPHVVMAVGGWESFQAIEPYLNAPSSEDVNGTFEDVGLV